METRRARTSCVSITNYEFTILSFLVHLRFNTQPLEIRDSYTSSLALTLVTQRLVTSHEASKHETRIVNGSNTRDS